MAEALAEPGASLSSISGRRKAAMLCVALGPDAAAEITEATAAKDTWSGAASRSRWHCTPDGARTAQAR